MLAPLPVASFYRLIGPGPCVLVTTGTPQRPNVAPVAWHMPVNDEPPLLALAVAETHCTAELIRAHGAFAVNVPTEELLPALLRAGGVSGRDTDKFALTGLAPAPGTAIAVPHLAAAAAVIECSVRDITPYDGDLLVVGTVLHAAADPALFRDTWLPEARLLHHLGGGAFSVPGRVVRG